ncbi:hypothetical protein ACFLZX_01205 [Nanoarchaeota archaeon]
MMRAILRFDYRILLIAIIFISLILPVNAQELEDIPCFSRYNFGSIEFDDVDTILGDFEGGASVPLIATITNTNPYPVVDGHIRAQVFYLDGEDKMIDEFYIAENIAINPNETMTFEKYYLVPENQIEGQYQVDLFFITSKIFNLAGVSFIRGLPGGTATFNVVGGNEIFYFDNDKITVNGEPKSLREYSSVIQSNTPVEVTVPLINKGPAKDIEVSYKLYSWDDMREIDLVTEQSKTETVSLGAQQTETLKYTFDGLAPDAYLIRLEATSGDKKSILKIRIPIRGKKVKFNYAALSEFPIKSGSEIEAFLCAENSPSADFFVKSDLSLKVVDLEGNIIHESTKNNVDVPPSIGGYSTSFTSIMRYNDVDLIIEAKDETGYVEKITIPYRYSDLVRPKFFIKTKATSTYVTLNVEAQDDEFNPVKTTAHLIIKNKETGKILKLFEDVEIDGGFEKIIRLDPGEYTVRVTRNLDNKGTQQDFIIPSKGPLLNYLNVGLILLAIIVLYLVIKALRKK